MKTVLILLLALVGVSAEAAISAAAKYELNNKMGAVAHKHQLGDLIEQQGIVDQIASSTTSLTSVQCGSTVVSNSADVVTLPEASTVLGCRFTFVCGTADDLDVNPADGTDQIGPVVNITGTNTTTALAPAAGDAIRCTDIGSSITLEAVGANLWVAIGATTGTWTDVN